MILLPYRYNSVLYEYGSSSTLIKYVLVQYVLFGL